jgi:hypothetical protein
MTHPATRRVHSMPAQRRRAEALVRAWNDAHPGEIHRCVYRRDNGKAFETRTRSSACVLSGHTAVIWLDGISGCVDLERVLYLEGA